MSIAFGFVLLVCLDDMMIVLDVEESISPWRRRRLLYDFE